MKPFVSLNTSNNKADISTIFQSKRHEIIGLDDVLNNSFFAYPFLPKTTCYGPVFGFFKSKTRSPYRYFLSMLLVRVEGRLIIHFCFCIYM